MDDYSKSQELVSDKLINFVVDLQDKKAEYDYLKNQQHKIALEMYNINQAIKNTCKDYIQDVSNNIIKNHSHYINNHHIEVRSEYQYDYDWFKETYGRRNPVQSNGLPYEYEGPDTMMYVFCKECDEYFTQAYRKNDVDNVEERGLDLYRNGILKKEITNLENTFLKGDIKNV